MDALGAPLGSRIANAVTEEFNKLKVKSGKPTTRSNGVQEWTVLAGLVAIEDDEISVLTLATGVKAMPDTVRSYSSGWIVHDMHAEILCLRLFNWHLLEEIKAGKSNGSKYLVAHENRYLLRPNIKLALYISEPPCGDASMSTLVGEAWEPKRKMQKTDIVRGRAHFDKLGIVRTKPGRADSSVTLSKSCSDKLCLRQSTGITNALTSLLVDPIFLDYLVLRRDKYNEEDFNRCFCRTGRKMEALTYESDSYEFYKSGTPSPLSLLYHVPTKTVEVLNNGVKNGSYVKNKPPKPSGASIVSNRKMAEKALGLGILLESYQKVKSGNVDREKLKGEVKEKLGNWVQTSLDDFDLKDVVIKHT